MDAGDIKGYADQLNIDLNIAQRGKSGCATQRQVDGSIPSIQMPIDIVSRR